MSSIDLDLTFQKINELYVQKEYEKVALEVVNKVGVDINRIGKFPHMSAPLQFICGLGSRKS